jgi:WhiB family redox-sensing transcriptional regulator
MSVDPCMRCHRLMRPRHTGLAEYPGTVGRENATTCQTCHDPNSLPTSPIVGDTRWQDQALCVQTDSEVFFPEQGGSARAAKRVCARCEAKDPCLKFALDNHIRHGIWGGHSERERRPLEKDDAA